MNTPKKPVIEGIKLIKHNMAGINNADDPSYPFRLNMTCRVPEFMEVAASMIYGREEVVVRGMTEEALEQLIAANNFRTHPRLIKLEITQPEVLEAAAKAALPPPPPPVVEVPVHRRRPGPKSRITADGYDCDRFGYTKNCL